MLTVAAPTQIDRAVAQLDAWLDTMRGPGGYGGPVAHWWQQCLLYTGLGFDWRYEGIIAGYLTLWERTSDDHWLAKAQRAGDDLCANELDDGHYPASAFELNPATAGTPHEAACDVALLLLAAALWSAGSSDWQRYAQRAERNLHMFYLQQLWDVDSCSFRDSPTVASFVPNKAATICEALFLLADVTRNAVWVEQYALPTLQRILQHQVRGGRLDGAIAQNSFGTHVVTTYFPIYIARCIPALLRGYGWTNEERYLDAAQRALRFVSRWQLDDGSLPTAIYANGRCNRYPSWIAPLGDVLRACDLLRPFGATPCFDATRAWLQTGQDVTGGIQTARGFEAQVGGRPGQLPDVRDVLHVVGWCDKAFRYLAAHVSDEIQLGISHTFERDCTFRGRRMQLRETPELLEICEAGQVCYRWLKGTPLPAVAAPVFWLK